MLFIDLLTQIGIIPIFNSTGEGGVGSGTRRATGFRIFNKDKFSRFAPHFKWMSDGSLRFFFFCPGFFDGVFTYDFSSAYDLKLWQDDIDWNAIIDGGSGSWLHGDLGTGD